MKRYPFIRTAFTILTVIVITGCTLHGRGLTPEEIRQRSERDLAGFPHCPSHYRTVVVASGDGESD